MDFLTFCFLQIIKCVKLISLLLNTFMVIFFIRLHAVCFISHFLAFFSLFDMFPYVHAFLVL